MARRTLAIVIESGAQTCGNCRHLRIDIFTSRYECRVFRGKLQTTAHAPVAAIRHPECLRAETFAGG
jgi:hypothetical protein